MKITKEQLKKIVEEEYNALHEGPMDYIKGRSPFKKAAEPKKAPVEEAEDALDKIMRVAAGGLRGQLPDMMKALKSIHEYINFELIKPDGGLLGEEAEKEE